MAQPVDQVQVGGRRPAGPFLVGLVGTGVRPSLTPALHMAEAAALGLTHVYRTVDLTERGIDPQRIGDVLRWARDLGFDALNVTHPCKQLVLPHLDVVDPVARALGAVNTVLFTERGAVGHNTDTTGFEAALRTGLPGAPLGRVVLVGAGGAGAAVADALLRCGTDRLTVVDVQPQRAGELAHALTGRHGRPVDPAAPDALAGLVPVADGVVHCTPVGMAEHPGTAFDVGLLRPATWVADVVYRPLETGLLTAARAAGCRTLDGGHMAVHQAVGAFELITGVRPDAARMLAHLRALVAA